MTGRPSRRPDAISPGCLQRLVGSRAEEITVSQGLTGGTTVAATMFAAHAAGVRVFSTGGIGGVHRGAEESESTVIYGMGQSRSGAAKKLEGRVLYPILTKVSDLVS